MSGSRVSLNIPSDPAVLDEVREFVTRTVLASPLSVEAYDLAFAAHEAILNVIEHGYEGAFGATIELVIEYDEEKVLLQVRDQGPPFDPTAFAEPDVKGSLKDGKEPSLGIMLIRAYMDEVHYSRVDTTNELTLVKRATKAA